MKYKVPIIESFNMEDLEELMELAACSTCFSCFWGNS